MSIPGSVVDELKIICPADRILIDSGECWVYGNDNSRRHAPPELVIFPESHDEVVAIVKICVAHNIPITPRGRGSGTTGGATAPYGGVMISFERMNQILDLNITDRTLCAQPGVTNEEIQKHCLPHNMFWPPDPGSAAYCTLGGNLACNAAGPHALKYGTTRDNTLQIKAVSGDGSTLLCGAITSKSVVGLDLTRLLIGSEGCLAIITEAVVKLSILPKLSTSICLEYSSVESAIESVCKIMQQHHTPCALEFLDNICVSLLREHSDQRIDPNTDAILIIEFDGSKSEVTEALGEVRISSHHPDLIRFNEVENESDAQSMWRTRKALSPVLRNYKPNKINEDVVVPLSELIGFIKDIRQIASKYDLCIANFGHIGNGNLHINILYNDEKKSCLQSALDDLFNSVISRKGSISGEHGVGLSKLDYVNLEIDQPTLKKMQEIKHIFDPHNILNKGKALPR